MIENHFKMNSLSKCWWWMSGTPVYDEYQPSLLPSTPLGHSRCAFYLFIYLFMWYSLTMDGLWLSFSNKMLFWLFYCVVAATTPVSHIDAKIDWPLDQRNTLSDTHIGTHTTDKRLLIGIIRQALLKNELQSRHISQRLTELDLDRETYTNSNRKKDHD